ncbi:MAG: hypothetical protein IID58_09690, partial [Proteobacteria bacterium]|nr:hypothetical protein [Pseudomonadota bacterium]
KLITAVVHAIYPLISTVAHNVNPDREEDSWAQINVHTQSIRKGDIPRLRRISFDRLTAVSESIDDLFMAYETLHDNDASNNDESTVAIGVFYFEERGEKEDIVW